jgi:hypothetical protein
MEITFQCAIGYGKCHVQWIDVNWLSVDFLFGFEGADANYGGACALAAYWKVKFS